MKNEKLNQGKPVRHSPKGEGGFTLIEVLLAFLILMLGILAVLALFPVGMKLSRSMIETSTAALVARNARGCMEATNLADAITPIQSGIPRLTGPRYFPSDMSGSVVNDFTTALTNTTVNPPINCSVRNGKIVDTANPLYSWDARFSVGQGAYSLPWGWTPEEAQEWFFKYFRYYAVQISVYRGDRKSGYEEIDLGSGTISGVVTDVDPTDRNIIAICRLTLSSIPADLEVGWHIRIPNERSDWYRIEKINIDNNKILILDRPYVGSSGSKSGIIATGSLVGHFTTFLAAYNE